MESFSVRVCIIGIEYSSARILKNQSRFRSLRSEGGAISLLKIELICWLRTMGR
jgi:hypothetical protein